MNKRKIVLSMCVVLSLLILGGIFCQAEAIIVADAGDDITITTDDVSTTIIIGYVTDTDNSGYKECAWTNAAGVDMTPLMVVGPNGECPLDLSTSPIALESGVYTMRLVGLWPEFVMDDMILTIVDANSTLLADAGADITITTDEIATTIIMGYVTDPDNTGWSECFWTNSAGVDMTPLMAVGPNGECPLDLSTSPIVLGEDVYTLTLVGWDASAIVTDTMILTIVDANTAPSVNAGPNVSISSEEVATTIISEGILISDLEGDLLECRWLEGGIVEQDWTAVVNGGCPLDLVNFSTAIGTFTMTLEVRDGKVASDDMILTIENSAPHAAPGGSGVYELNTDVILVGDASDFDGDSLNYVWTEGLIEGSNTICSGTVQTVAGGDAIMLPNCVLSNLSLGIHTFTLQVDDGLNLPDSNIVIVEIVDTSVPTLSPISDKYILWPPNHNMVDISIATNASDNSGVPPALSVNIASNEPQYGLGDGDVGPDYNIVSVDHSTGTIHMQLRRERSGSGNGRKYTVTITATDNSLNTSTATLGISVPHDKRK